MAQAFFVPRKLKKIALVVGGCTIYAFCHAACGQSISSSPNFILSRDAVSAGGGATISTLYRLHPSLGQSVAGPLTAGTNFREAAGIWHSIGAANAVDNQAPSIPASVTATVQSPTQIHFCWNASSDNVVVTLYRIYRGGVQVATVNAPATCYDDTGLVPSTSYTYSVTACDVAGNCSVQSASASATTQALPTYLLTVNNGGNGTVASNPASIACGATCSAGFNSGVSVTLTAAPNSGYNFGAWTGCDSAIGVSCTVTMNAARAISASFTLSPGTLPVALVFGFNLLGNSYTAALNVATAFGNVVDNLVVGVSDRVDAVWRWNATTQKWQFYSPQLTAAQSAAYATGHGYEVLSSVPGGEGFWVNAYQAFTLSVPSIAPFNYGLVSFGSRPHLWNLLSVGSALTPQQFNQTVGTPPAPGIIPQNFESLWAWNAILGKWYFYSPQLEAGVPQTNCQYAATNGLLCFDTSGKQLDPGTGFWVYRP